MPRRKPVRVTLFEDPKKSSFGERHVAQSATILKSGKLSRKSKFSAQFIPNGPWSIETDSRSMLAVIGDSAMAVIRPSVAADKNPATGRSFPDEYKDFDGKLKRREKLGPYMAKHLRRTVTDSNKKWGGGFKRLSGTRSRLKFFFADKEAATINSQDDSRQRGRKHKAVRLTVSGRVATSISQGLEDWLDKSIAGEKFARDTRRRARGFL